MNVKLMLDSKKEKQMIFHSISSKTSILLANNPELRDNPRKWNLTDVYQVFHLLKFLKLETNGIVPNAKTISLPKSNLTFTERQKF